METFSRDFFLSRLFRADFGAPVLCDPRVLISAGCIEVDDTEEDRKRADTRDEPNIIPPADGGLPS